jgi:hypothetical protein
VNSRERASYVRGMIIEPGVYRDKPTGAILLILGMRRVNGGDDYPNYEDLVDLVVLSSGDVSHEWPDEGVFMQAIEEVFDNSRRGADGRIIPDTHLERIV